MTYDPYDAKQEQEHEKDRQETAGKRERALRSERGSKPATPVVPLSESDPAAAVGVGRDAGNRPARPTTPPGTPPATPSVAPPMTPSKAAPATPSKAAPAAATEPEKDPLAGPVQDPVHPVEPRDTTRKSTPAPARETATTRETAPGRTPESTPAQTPRLIPQEECDKLNLRLQEALSTFVDGPRRSVEEAAGVLEEAAKRLTKALADQPRTLRDSWDAGGGKNGGSGADTEDLRLALRSYREVTERLLRI